MNYLWDYIHIYPSYSLLSIIKFPISHYLIPYITYHNNIRSSFLTYNLISLIPYMACTEEIY